MTARAMGRVAAVWRYPVKSMAAEALERADISWHGIVGDRRWAFIRSGVERSGFPWLTIREKPEMRHYVPRFVDPDQPNKSLVMVRSPGGQDFDIIDPVLAAELGHGARVIKQDIGVFDTFPLSLISIQTIQAMGGLVGLDLDPQRFRPNLLIDAPDAPPFFEEEWIGMVIRVGAMRMRIDKRDGRCVMVNIDPRSTESNPVVLKTIVSERGSQLGVYGTTVKPGLVQVGDVVSVED